MNGGTSVSLSRNFEPWRTVGTLAQQLSLHVMRELMNSCLLTLIQLCAQVSSSLRILSLVRREVNVPFHTSEAYLIPYLPLSVLMRVSTKYILRLHI